MQKPFIIHVNYNVSGWINVASAYPGYPTRDSNIQRLFNKVKDLEIPAYAYKLVDERQFTTTQAASGLGIININKWFTHYVDNEGHLHLYYDPNKDWDLSLELEIHRQKLLEEIWGSAYV